MTNLLIRIMQLLLAMIIASSFICITLVVLFTFRVRNVQAARIIYPLTQGVYEPVLELSKDGPDAAEVGEIITFTFSVFHHLNSDQSPVMDIVISDTIAFPINGPIIQNGDNDDILESGETWFYTATYIVQPSDPNLLTNLATVTGRDLDGDHITANDNHFTNIEYNPTLTFLKTGPATAKVGETVVFSFTLTNDTMNGDGSPINNISINDNLIGPVRNRTIASGDNDNDLEMGEIWTYTTTYTVPATDTDILVNTATVQAEDQDGDILTVTAMHSTNLLPALNVLKTGFPTTANVNDTIVFTFSVTNDTTKGDGTPINLTFASVSDSIAGLANFVGGDNGNGLLEQGETWTFTATYTVEPTDPHTMPNIVTVTGADLVDNVVITATDTHTTIVEHEPVLKITKQSKPLDRVKVGQTIIYEFEVDHSFISSDRSDLSPVTIISVIDSLADIANLDLGNSTGAGDGMLHGGDKWVYEVTAIVQPTAPDPLTNTAMVIARDLDGDDDITATTTVHQLDIEFEPELAVTETGPDVARINDTIVYTFVVTNDGSSTGGDGSPITSVTVIDRLVGSIVNSQKDNSDFDSWLEMGEEWIYTATYTIPATDSFDLPNTVNVYSQDRDDDPVPIATAAHTVNLLPVLTITKTGKATAKIGERVTLTFTINHADNSNSEPVRNVNFDDEIGVNEIYIGGDTNTNDELDPGESWVFTVSFTIPTTANDSLPNTFTVTGEDQAAYAIEAIHPYSIEIKPGTEPLYFPVIFKNHLVCSTQLVDHFDNANSGWLTDNFNDEAIYSYVPSPDEYNIELRQDVVGHSMSPFGSFDQYIVKVKARWADTSLGAWYGIIFGINGATNQRVSTILQTGHLYRFIVDTRSNDPKFTLELFDGDHPTWRPVTSGWSNHSSIKKGTELNTLEVRCYGPRAEIYVNDNPDPLWSDGLPLTCSGQIGVTSRFDLSQSSTNARFDDFEVCGQRSSSLTSNGNGVEISIPID